MWWKPRFSLLSLFSPQIISQRNPVFGGNPGPLQVQPVTEQPELWLFRCCFSLFLSERRPAKRVLAPEPYVSGEAYSTACVRQVSAGDRPMLMGGFACGRFPFKGCLFQMRRVT